MAYYATSQEWLQQSSLLLQARPTTTRITTKYTSLPAGKKNSRSRHGVSSTSAAPADQSTTEPSTTAAVTAASQATGPTAQLTLKTYDPVSGVCLKYRTDKAAEVGRLIASLGRLARTMAALPEEAESTDVAMADASESAAAVVQEDTGKAKAENPQSAQAGAGGAGGKKKKKGKK